MTESELKKLKEVFGDELQTVEVKKPEFDIPEVFDNYAVYLSDDFEKLILKEAKILPAKLVKCHGVIPPSDEYVKKYSNLPIEQQPFNCIVGDYTENQHLVWIRGLETNILKLSEDHLFGVQHVWGMPTGFANGHCRAAQINSLIHTSTGYFGFFTTLENARAAIKQKFEFRKQELNNQLALCRVYESCAEKILENKFSAI